MRFLVLVVLAIFVALPVWGQTKPGISGHNFGSIVCPQKMPCPEDSNGSMSSSALASAGDACITQYFGYTSSSGFFDTNAGLDGNNCLTPIPGLLPTGMGNPLIQACCVVKLPTNACAMRCELNAQ